MQDGARIFFYDGSKNWWSRNGAPESTPIGDPCGPDSEMFYEFDFVDTIQNLVNIVILTVTAADLWKLATTCSWRIAKLLMASSSR